MTIEEFMDIWAFSYQREKMKADLEEMIQEVGQKAAQAGYELGRKPLGNTVSWKRFTESTEAKEDARKEG